MAKRKNILTREEAGKMLRAFLSTIDRKPIDLARETGLDMQRVFKAVRGSSYLTIDGYKVICEHYNVNANYFLGLSSRLFNDMSFDEMEEQKNYKLLYTEAKKDQMTLNDSIELYKQLIQSKDDMIERLKQELEKAKSS